MINAIQISYTIKETLAESIHVKLDQMPTFFKENPIEPIWAWCFVYRQVFGYYIES
jgi:hypothetical protein